MDGGQSSEPLLGLAAEPKFSAPPPSARRRSARYIIIALASVLCVSVLYLQTGRHILVTDTAAAAEPLGQCIPAVPLLATPPAPVNPWASLSIAEAVRIQKWLAAPVRGLNLTSSDVARVNDNTVFLVEAYYPPKADALAYLASPYTVAPPPRYARVTIHHGATAEPFIRDYLVGPLPIGATSTIRPLTEIYHRPDIPFHARGVEPDDVFSQIMPPLADAMEALLGGTARGLPNDTLVRGGSAPWSFDGSFRRSWISFKRNTAGSWVNPTKFFIYVDMPGTDMQHWKILKVVYNHQVFPSTEAFLDAFHNGTLERLPGDPGQEDLSWSSRKRVGTPRDLDHLPGPRSVAFAGLRFRVDRARQFVTWMGWSLYLGFDRDMGLSLWDIRIKGERIIYQLSPQEAMAQYAGTDPVQMSTAWLDRYFGMGALVRDMLPGYDCPHDAVYLPATTHTRGGSFTAERAVCIFEQDTARPLSRHTGFSANEFGAVKGYVLTIRSVTTVGKYVAMTIFDYMFHLDGTIEVRLSASGYLQGTFYDGKQEGYGTRISERSMGSLHDHVINYKVDLDIAGADNTLLLTTTSQEEVTAPWFDEDWGSTVVQQRVTKTYIANEDDARVRFPANFQGGYSVVNQDARNRWGLPRGYAIHPGYSPIHNTVVGSRRLLNNANWARYNLAVSKRKETEPSASSMWNLHLPGAPTVDFARFFDGENITQTDIVAWVNIGTHHLPQAEDAPNTRTNTATSSFFITPLNYFDADISLDSANAILLEEPATPGGAYGFDDNGVRQDFTCVPAAPPAFEYFGMHGHGLDGAPISAVGMEGLKDRGKMGFPL